MAIARNGMSANKNRSVSTKIGTIKPQSVVRNNIAIKSTR
jgi:hypothetical protein